MLRAYEFMIILDGDLEDTVAQTWVKKEHGYYIVFNLLAPGGALDDFERQLRLADEVVRHKLLRLPDAEAEKRGMVDAAA
jgi:small subunit ribosomal protein S6